MGSGTFKDIADKIARTTVAEFAEHVLTVEGDGRWHCGRPGTGFYSFRVIAAPGALLMYGDLGDIILRPSDRDALRWLRGSSSRDYVLSKSEGARDGKEFYAGDAEAYLAEYAAEGDDYDEEEKRARRRERVETIREYWDVEDGDGLNEWYAAWAAVGACDVSDCRHWSSTSLWQFEALRWFCGALERAETAASPAATPLVPL